MAGSRRQVWGDACLVVSDWAGARRFRGGSRRRVRRTSGGGQRGVGDKGCGGLRACVWGRVVNLVERAGGAA